MATQKKPAKKSGGVAKKSTAAKKPVAKKLTAKPVHKSSKKASTKKTVSVKANKTVKKSAIKTTKKAAPKKAAAKIVSSAKKTVKKPAKAPSVKTSKTIVPTVKKNNAKVEAKKEPAKSVKKATTKQIQSAHSHKEKKTEKQPQVTSRRRDSDHNKTVVYQPEFIKSVLDQPEQNNGPVFRYSDTELQEFKDLILKKLDAAKKELVYLQGLITRKDETGTEDTENKYMSMEDGSGTMEREQLNQMASRQIQFIDHLEKALMRIENKTYGICRVTGKLIDKARLRAVPHATLSIEAKQAMNK